MSAKLKQVFSDSQLSSAESNSDPSGLIAERRGLPAVLSKESSTEHVMRDEATFIQDVSQFFNQEQLSDIILKVGTASYFGHKFVLAKSSEVFRTMLYDRSWSQASKTEVDLEESEECQKVFDKFLRYLYTAELRISDITAVGLLCLADKYNVSSLKELCVKYMICNSRSPRVTNALNWYSWAKLLNLPDLLDTCSKTISWNYADIICADEWLNMNIEFLCDFLQSSELVVPNEFAIWEAVVAWLQHDSRADSIGENVQRLLPLVRFSQMLVQQLFQLESCEMSEVCGDILSHLLSRAHRFRTFCPQQQQIGLTFQEPFYLPRDYKDLTVDTVRIQNTLRFGIQVDVRSTKSPVPTDVRDAEWKATYRKQGDIWSIQFFCHESALVNNEAHIEPSIIVYDEQEKIIQVQRESVIKCTRGSTVTVQMIMQHPELSKSIGVLIKPVPT